ncbi:MAG: deoxyguanosinetriphosphate triphosphohydrolase [Burkholderiaceae bacterium]
MPVDSGLGLGEALASYASRPEHSRGRFHRQDAAPTRNDFQRDRDRVIHATAFRRLVYKTQVFLNHEGDLFRTRLTHSLEVAQLGRSLARSLGLHEDLVEAIALAHDLGHTPFGHAGQDALNEVMRQFSDDHSDPEAAGFEHNLQSLRVVDTLERCYPDFDGLNLTFETREGVLKHCSLRNAQRLEMVRPNDVGARFINKTAPSLEAQLCNLADEIAYNAHDVDDGVRSGLIDFEQLQVVPLIAAHARAACEAHPALRGRRLLAETIRRMLTAQVYDVMDHTRAQLAAAGVQTADEVRAYGRDLVGFSPAMRAASTTLKQFLFANLYRHPQVSEKSALARQVVMELFTAYRGAPHEMATSAPATSSLNRAIADYIAGMTDRFAIKEHARLTGMRLFATDDL